MFCSNCAAPLADNARFCSNCGTTAPAAKVPEQPVSPLPPAVVPETSGKAIASLVCGIINIFPLFVIAVVLGHLSLSDIRKSGGRLKGQGLAIAGLVLGYLGVVIIPFILIVAAIAIPNLLRARISANESSAVASVRNLVAAEVQYQGVNQHGNFTCNLSDLSQFVGSELASGSRHGYVFKLQNCGSERYQGDVVLKFQVTAVPVTVHNTGVRAFCSDESRHYSNGRERFR